MFKSIVVWLLKTVFSAFVDEIIERRKEEKENEENTAPRESK